MNMTKSVLTIGALAAIAFAVPLQAQTSLSLYGDIDCFGTGGPCVEDGSTWLPGGAPSVTATASDAALTDRVFNTSGISSWTHTFAATTSDAWLRMRTAGIADVAGP